MNLDIPVIPPPPPVLPFKINITYKYFVVRGDGGIKVFDSMHGSSSGSWLTRGNLPVRFAEEILIPMDLVTALMLGLVQPHELELPEHLKAFVNMIKP